MRRIVIPLIALTAVAYGGSSSSGPTEAPLNITAAGIASNTGSTALSIPVGGRVHYFNKDTAPHTIVAAGTSGCAADLSSDGPIAPGGNQLRPVMSQTENCTLNDSTNTALTASVAVVAAPAGGGGGGGGGSGY
jgi:hypothetical protein